MKNHLRRCFYFLVMVLSLAAGPVQARETAVPSAKTSEELQKVERLYAEGRYTDAQTKLGFLSERSMTAAEKGIFYRLKIRLSYAFEDLPAMRLWVDHLLALEPRASLDKMRDPPEALAYLEKKKSLQPDVPQRSDDPLDKSFFWSLTPFGVGHVYHRHVGSGLLFLLADAGVVAHGFSRDQELQSGSDTEIGIGGGTVIDINHGQIYGTALGLGLFLGVWGYEVLALMPELERIDARRAAWHRGWLSVAPLGVGQWQNEQYVKGTAVAVLEMGLLAVAYYGDDVQQRHGAAYGLLAACLFGAIDGAVNDRPEASSAAAQLMPFLAKSRGGEILGLQLQLPL